MRYSFAPIDAHRGDTEISVLADKLGVSHGAVQRWRERGMDAENADRCATALGLHPWMLWPEMLVVDTVQVTRECEVADCYETFILTRSDKRFCSARCRNRSPEALARRAKAQRTRRQAETVEERERRIENARAYKARAKRSLSISSAAYYQRTAEKQKADRKARYWAQKEQAA